MNSGKKRLMGYITGWQYPTLLPHSTKPGKGIHSEPQMIRARGGIYNQFSPDSRYRALPTNSYYLLEAFTDPPTRRYSTLTASWLPFRLSSSLMFYWKAFPVSFTASSFPLRLLSIFLHGSGMYILFAYFLPIRLWIPWGRELSGTFLCISSS